MDSSSNSTALTCKVVLIGEAGVGKTSIISRYVKNTYSSDCPPTPGASFASKVINYIEHDKVIKFDVSLDWCLLEDLGHCGTRKISQPDKDLLSKL